MALKEIKPYSQNGSKHEQVEAMFDNIAPTYDYLNHTLSFGIDRWWRKSAISYIRRNCGDRMCKMLDIATGTGDLAIEAYRAVHPEQIVGCDISDEMMKIGEKKVGKLGFSDFIRFCHEDCSALSFGDGQFDVVMSAFALRNFENLDDCLAEMHRVTGNSGHVVVIDLCAPRRFPMNMVFAIYKRVVMPLIGRMVSKDCSAYTYLPETMSAIIQGEEMAQHFAKAGFRHVTHKYLAFGMCCMYTGEK